ncbi:CsgG/HfaB family protein [Asticcacaulis tiandongensis]|uniref:CsgG/HfaB family protein n=1 Tax=Asticcacaulis tiandongensis TaxID=2565365 RepID=UPI0011291227|nr:CsgG/HfaB family protein [Asticcacaulis tiandongensis]
MMQKSSLLAVGTALALVSLAPSVMAQAKASKAQQQQDKMVAEIPRCSKSLGTISIVNGDDAYGWTQSNLAPPQKLLRVIVQKSGCFTLVDRGAGLNAAQAERNLNQNLGLQRGSNVGQNQVKAADFVLVAEVAAADSNTGGNAAAGIVGGLIGGRAGAVVGGLRTKKLEANTVLSLTDVRTTESFSFEGTAAKNDLSWGAGGGGFGLGGAVGGGYEDTEIGRIVTQAFIVAYGNMVAELGGIDVGGKAAAPSRSFTVATATTLRSAPTGGGVVRALPVGLLLYPTGNKEGMWWEVIDDNDNVGWVQNDKLTAAQ